MKRVLTSLVVVLALASGLRAADPPAKPMKVKFDLFPTKHIAVMIKINGKGPYRVVFDTGAPVTLISTKLAKENKLVDPKAPKPLFSPFNTEGEVKIKKLEIGDVMVENTSAMAMDHPAIEAMSKAFGGVEGIVGFPFFSKFKVTIDYKAKEMTFEPSGYEPPDIMKSMMGMVTAIARGNSEPKVLASAGQWGLVVDKETSDSKAGVTVKEVLAGGAAAKAGLKTGDRILTIDGRWTDSVAETFDAASLVKPGTEVKVAIVRDGKEMELTVKPGSGL